MNSLATRERIVDVSVLSGVAVAFVAVLALRTTLNRRYEASRRVLDDANILTPSAARILSLGHTEWATDLLWINATLYYGDTLYAHLPARYSSRYTETMNALDPNFRRAYLWGANAMLYRTVASTPEDARAAGRVLLKGLQRFPTDPELHLQYGYNLAYDQATVFARGSPERIRLRSEAAEHLRIAASSGFGDRWISLTTSGLFREVGRDRDAVLVLCDGMLHSDEQNTSVIEHRIAELLRGHADEDPFFLAMVNLVRERKRVHPWMPLTLHVMVGNPMVGNN
jgi:hypothetical protein